MEQAMSTRATGPVRAPLYSRILCGVDGSPAALEAAAQAAALTAVGGRLEFTGISEYALRDARRIAAMISDDVEVVLARRAGEYAPRHLIEEAAAYDLLVVESALARAVHHAHTPVLVARRAPPDVPFPKRILVGSSGAGDPEAAIALGARIARLAHGQTIELAVSGDAPRKLVEAAAGERVSLVIVGSRGAEGLGALRGTSERVALEAPCSVLVLRH